LESPERVANLVVLKFQTTLFAVPFRVTSDFEAESFVVAESVFVFQFLPDRDFETATLAPLNRILVVSDVGTEFASVLLVAPVRRWVGVFTFLLEGEERSPRFAVLARDLLNGRATDDTVVASSLLRGVPHVAVTEVVLTTFVGQFVPQRG
jgi:hypothetical protein